MFLGLPCKFHSLLFSFDLPQVWSCSDFLCQCCPPSLPPFFVLVLSEFQSASGLVDWLAQLRFISSFFTISATHYHLWVLDGAALLISDLLVLWPLLSSNCCVRNSANFAEIYQHFACHSLFQAPNFRSIWGWWFRDDRFLENFPIYCCKRKWKWAWSFEEYGAQANQNHMESDIFAREWRFSYADSFSSSIGWDFGQITSNLRIIIIEKFLKCLFFSTLSRELSEWKIQCQ